MKNKVLVISYYFPPMGLSGVQRVAKFVKYMKYHNWQPTVITINPKSYYAFDQSLLDELESSEIKIIRTDSKDPTQFAIKQSKIKSDLFRKLLNRISQTFFLPDNKLWWKNKAIKSAKEILDKEKFEVIFASAPPYTCLRIGAALKSKYNIPLILDYRDAWLDDVLSFYPTPIHRAIVKKMEESVLRSSNKIIVYTRQIKEHILKNYPFLSSDEIKIIPHGFDEEDFLIDWISNKPKNKMRITYSGIFYDLRTPKYFIEAVRELFFERPDLSNKIEFCFVGNFPKRYLRLIKEYHLDSAFNIVGYLAHKEAVRYLLDSDVLWLIINHSKNPHLVATGKLYEYFGTRKPILGCVPEGAASQLLREYNASIITPPGDVQKIKDALLKFYEIYDANNLPRPNDEFVEKFNRKNLIFELVREFQFQLEA